MDKPQRYVYSKQALQNIGKSYAKNQPKMKNKIYGAISPTEDKQVDVRAAAASLKKNSCDRTILVPKNLSSKV